jgi:hypothetical protein
MAKLSLFTALALPEFPFSQLTRILTALSSIESQAEGDSASFTIELTQNTSLLHVTKTSSESKETIYLGCDPPFASLQEQIVPGHSNRPGSSSPNMIHQWKKRR